MNREETSFNIERNWEGKTDHVGGPFGAVANSATHIHMEWLPITPPTAFQLACSSIPPHSLHGYVGQRASCMRTNMFTRPQTHPVSQTHACEQSTKRERNFFPASHYMHQLYKINKWLEVLIACLNGWFCVIIL
jgi:hypothetical protein